MLNMLFQGYLWIYLCAWLQLEQDRPKWNIDFLWVINPPWSRKDKVDYLFLLMISIRYDMLGQVDYKIYQ